MKNNNKHVDIITKSSTVKELLLIKIITNFILGGLLIILFKIPFSKVLNTLELLTLKGSVKSQIIYNVFYIIGNIFCMVGLFNIFLGMLLAFILILRKDDYKYLSSNGKKLLNSFDIIGQTIVTYRDLNCHFSKHRKNKLDRFLFFLSKMHLQLVLTIFIISYTLICFLIPVQGVLMLFIIFIIFIIKLSSYEENNKRV